MSVRKYGRKKDSQERYDRFIRLFTEWGKIKYFEDLTEQNIISYDRYLVDKGMKPYSKWNNYHRFINGFILDAIKEGIMSKNPYDWININKDKSRTGIDKYLTFEEFKKIKESPMPTLCLEKVRDLFVFQTYTCLRYSDLAAFDSNRIQKINGMPVYLGDSIKTTKRFTIPLLTPAIEILNKYNGKLPIISNVKYNLYLKNVAQAAGIDKALSTHWARHTGATMLLNEGAEMNNKETGETFKSCIFTDNAENRCFVAFSSKMGELSPREIVAMKDELQVVQLESGNYSLCKVGQNAWEDVDLGL